MKPSKLEDNRLLQVLAVLFFIYLIYLLLIGSKPKIAEQYVIQSEVKLPAKAPEKVVATPGQKAAVIFNSTFDSQGFPTKPPGEGLRPESGVLVGRENILKMFQEKLGSLPPEEIMKNFEGKFGHYWKDPKNPDFLAKSQEMGKKLTETADRNRKLVQSMVDFLESESGKHVSSTLKENLAKAVNSPARDTMAQGFSAWKNGNLDRAYSLLKQAEARDPDSPYIQIISHQAMAFLNMEKHGPLEETMRQYRHLAEESNKYITSFKPALVKAGFDPVKLYGRDPFDASRLPSSEQFERAMNYSKYVQFERKYYQKHKRSPGRSFSTMQTETREYMRSRQKGGAK